jgi:hypothetical protein
MHLLLVLLQQLLGMLPSSKQAPQGEVVRNRQPNESRSEPDAFERLGLSQGGWMTTLPGRLCAEDIPPDAKALRRQDSQPAPFSPLPSRDAAARLRASEAAQFGRVGPRPALSCGEHPRKST